MIKNRGDLMIISVAIALTLIGILFIYSSSGPFCKFMSPPRPTWYFLLKQTFWALLAILVMFLMYRLDYEFIIRISPALLIMSIITLVVVFPLSRAEIKRWIAVGGISFQPSEFFKIGLAAFIARMAGKNDRREGYKKYLPGVLLALAGTLLVLLEPDLGTTALLITAIAILLYLAGFKKRHLLLLPCAGMIAVLVMVFGMGYERDRLESHMITLKDPFHKEANYQTRQSLVSFGSGGLIGKGLANGGQKHLFLPERHTDFILSAAAEEGGFLLVALILFLFGLFGFAAYKIAQGAVNIEGAMLVWGVALMIMLQASVNIGVALGILPVTGMTLPFISYGGSSLISCFIGVGMIASVARRSRSPRKYFKRLRA